MELVISGLTLPMENRRGAMFASFFAMCNKTRALQRDWVTISPAVWSYQIVTAELRLV